MKQSDLAIFSHMPTLFTERLLLRKMQVSDYRDMYEYASRADTTRYLLWSPHETPHVSKRYLAYLQGQYRNENFYDFALVLREEQKMIGTCGFTQFDLENNAAEIGYVLNPDYWGRGLATEAVGRIIRFAFEDLSLHRVTARIMAGNFNSERVAEKCGLRREATHVDSLMVKGEYRTIGEFAILSKEYYKINEAKSQSL